MSLGEIYFWTCTIKDWKKVLAPDKYKQIITDSLKQMVDKELITLYSFVYPRSVAHRPLLKQILLYLSVQPVITYV
ncbi:hypothetical protein [Marivirga lumbricoides]|uniref:hypothetical protein n=1 Tax=Marivirga lumbricoides TaxID=1046115 RepID=UPI001E47704C